MALYFFISGYFTQFSLKKKTFGEFLKDRIIRLGIPLVIVSCFMFTPLYYYLNGGTGNYILFAWDLYFNQPPLAVGHLWFVISLFVYSILIAFVVKYVDKSGTNGKLRLYHPLLWIIIVSMLNILMRETFPIDRWVNWGFPLEPAHLPNYILAFTAGYYISKNNAFEQIDWKMAISYFGLYLLMVVLAYFWENPENYYYVKILLENTLCVGVSLLLIKLFQLIPARTKGFLPLASENTYGTYLVHLFIVLGYQYVFLSIDVSAWTKFLAVLFLSFFTSLFVSILLREIPGVKKVI
jgi:glucan biosynthesis protein C